MCRTQRPTGRCYLPPSCKTTHSLVITSMSYSVFVQEVFVKHSHLFAVQGSSSSWRRRRETNVTQALVSITNWRSVPASKGRWYWEAACPHLRRRATSGLLSSTAKRWTILFPAHTTEVFYSIQNVSLDFLSWETKQSTYTINKTDSENKIDSRVREP